MQKKQHTRDALEAVLRQAAPALRKADPTRVEAACDRVAAAPSAGFANTCEPPHLGRLLARAAACLVLASGIAVLMRTPAAPTRLPTAPISTAELARTFDSVVNAPSLETSLTTEADDLTDDFTDLTIAIKNHAFSLIL